MTTPPIDEAHKIILDGVKNIETRKAFLEEMVRIGLDKRKLSGFRQPSLIPLLNTTTTNWNITPQPIKEVKAKISVKYKYKVNPKECCCKKIQPETTDQDDEGEQHHDSDHHHENNLDPIQPSTKDVHVLPVNNIMQSHYVYQQPSPINILYVQSPQTPDCNVKCHSQHNMAN